VIALAQVLLPFMVLSLYGVMRAIDPEIERAAQNLGAGPLQGGAADRAAAGGTPVFCPRHC